MKLAFSNKFGVSGATTLQKQILKKNFSKSCIIFHRGHNHPVTVDPNEGIEGRKISLFFSFFFRYFI